MKIIADHSGVPVKHGRALVSEVRLHYSVAGEDEPLFLLHGAPKTSYHRRRVIPLLTPYYTVVASDLRGLGDSGRPPGGFDMKNMAEDIAQPATHLGYGEFLIAGESWGAATAYQLATQYPERVKKLILQEMILPGLGLEDYSLLTRENVSTYVWLWHINLYSAPNFPEMLIMGKEREYFNYFMKHETRNPQTITPDALDEYVRCCSAPGGIRSICEIYRATLGDADQNQEAVKTKLKVPVLTVDSEYFIGAGNERRIHELAKNANAVILPWGYQLAEEDPEGLAAAYLDFLGRGD